MTVTLYRDLVVARSTIQKRFLDHAFGRDFERDCQSIYTDPEPRVLRDGHAAVADRIEGSARTWRASSEWSAAW